jgi:hypothetical protein
LASEGAVGSRLRQARARHDRTPAFSITARAAVFSPMARMTAGEGPMKTSPAAAHASAKAAFSARKP